MGSIASSLLSHLPALPKEGKLTVGILHDKQHEELTEFIAQLALRGSFHLIVGGEWIPDQDSLRRAVRHHTTAVAEVLERPNLGRPNCLQLRNQLEEAATQPHSVFILNFFHHFYDPDIVLTLQRRVLEDCCRCVKDLASSRLVLAPVRALPVDEYQDFQPFLNSFATEIIEGERGQAGATCPPDLHGSRAWRLGMVLT